MDFFGSNKGIVTQALEAWANHIKYGTCTPEYKAKMNDLSDDQIELVSRINKLKNDIFSGKVVVR